MNLLIRERKKQGVDRRDAGTDDFVVVVAGGSRLSISAASIEHILRTGESDVTWVRAQFDALVGVLTWEGHTVPVLRLETHLACGSGRGESPSTLSNRERLDGAILVIHHSAFRFGLLVSYVDRIASIPTSSIRAFPVETSAVSPSFYRGSTILDDQILLDVDLSALVPESLRSYLSAACDQSLEAEVAENHS